jgi:hypothetical protein
MLFGERTTSGKGANKTRILGFAIRQANPSCSYETPSISISAGFDKKKFSGV